MSGEPAFVGRMAELAELELLLSGAREGRGGCLLVAGEPGIGKTTLCTQFAERARRRIRSSKGLGLNRAAAAQRG